MEVTNRSIPARRPHITRDRVSTSCTYGSWQARKEHKLTPAGADKGADGYRRSKEKARRNSLSRRALLQLGN
jgi:hypothetical protein